MAKEEAYGPGGWYTNVQEMRKKGNSPDEGPTKEYPSYSNSNKKQAQAAPVKKEDTKSNKNNSNGGGGTMNGRIVGQGELMGARDAAMAEDAMRVRKAKAWGRMTRLEEEQLASMQSARNISEQKAYQDRLNSQWVPPSGGGFASRGTGTAAVAPASEYKAPVYDTERVEALAQRVAAPGIKKLRDQVQQVQGGVYENPNVKAMTLRQALGGYGSGLGDVMGGAFQTGSSIYGKEYDTLADTAKTNYTTNFQREQNALDRQQKQKEIDAQYQNSWAAWMAKNRSS